jgi:hypothetical protein
VVHEGKGPSHRVRSGPRAKLRTWGFMKGKLSFKVKEVKRVAIRVVLPDVKW